MKLKSNNFTELKIYLQRLILNDVKQKSDNKKHETTNIAIDKQIIPEYPANILMPDYVIEIVKTLHQNGHTTFVTGGAPRDLPVIEPNDYDLVTTATFSQIQSLFPGKIVGSRYPVFLVKRDDAKKEIQISTFTSRIDFSSPELVPVSNGSMVIVYRATGPIEKNHL